MNGNESANRHRRHLGTLARLTLDGHLEGIEITALSTSELDARIQTDTPDGAQTIARRIGVTAHSVRGVHHDWTGDYRGDAIRIVSIGTLTVPEPDATEDAALVAIASGVTA